MFLQGNDHCKVSLQMSKTRLSEQAAQASHVSFTNNCNQRASKHIRGFWWMWTLPNHRKMHFQPVCLYSVLDRRQRKAETGCPCCGRKGDVRAPLCTHLQDLHWRV